MRDLVFEGFERIDAGHFGHQVNANGHGFLAGAAVEFADGVLDFVDAIDGAADDDFGLLGVGEAVLADFIDLHADFAARAENIDFGDVFGGSGLDGHRRHHAAGFGFRGFLQVFQIAGSQFLADLGQCGEVDEIRAVIQPAGAATDERQHEQVVGGAAAYTKVDAAEISGLGGGAVLARGEKFEIGDGGRRCRQFEYSGWKRAFFRNDAVFDLHPAVWRRGALPSGGIAADNRVAPGIVTAFEAGTQFVLGRSQAGQREQNTTNHADHAQNHWTRRGLSQHTNRVPRMEFRRLPPMT